MTEFVYPPQTLLRRWGASHPGRPSVRETHGGRRTGEDGQDPRTRQMTTPLPVRQPHGESFTGPRRLTTEELGRRSARRAELDNPNFTGTLTAEDLKIASPSSVTRWLNNGQIHRDLGGPPPGHR